MIARDPYRCPLDGQLPPAGQSWHAVHDDAIRDLEQQVQQLHDECTALKFRQSELVRVVLREQARHGCGVRSQLTPDELRAAER